MCTPWLQHLIYQESKKVNSEDLDKVQDYCDPEYEEREE